MSQRQTRPEPSSQRSVAGGGAGQSQTAAFWFLGSTISNMGRTGLVQTHLVQVFGWESFVQTVTVDVRRCIGSERRQHQQQHHLFHATHPAQRRKSNTDEGRRADWVYIGPCLVADPHSVQRVSVLSVLLNSDSTWTPTESNGCCIKRSLK